MEDLIILAILALLVAGGIFAAARHFKGRGGCCGGGEVYISKKKLDNVIAKRTVMVEGMTCQNCVARVTRAVNDAEGLAAKVNLKKKQAVVSMARQVGDAELKGLIEKAGYTVTGFR